MNATADRQVQCYIETLPHPERALAQMVRGLLFELVPGIEERFSYKLPFYHFYGMFCYIHHDKTGLHLCFCRGKDLAMAFPQLEQKGRTTIASVTLRQSKDIEQYEVRQLIMAAAAWNKEAAALNIPVIGKGAKQKQKR